MIVLNPTISIITLNVNGPNIQIKKQRLSDWIKIWVSVTMKASLLLVYLTSRVIFWGFTQRLGAYSSSWRTLNSNVYSFSS